MKEQPDNQKIMADISAKMQECLSHYIGEMIAPSTMEKMKHSLCNVIKGFVANRECEDFSQYIDLNIDEANPNIIYIYPKKDSPEWVVNIFQEISKCQ